MIEVLDYEDIMPLKHPLRKLTRNQKRYLLRKDINRQYLKVWRERKRKK